MNWKVGLVAALLLIVPVTASEQAERECANPPCGWIQPYLDIIVDEKLTCGSGLRLGAEDIDPSECYAAPRDGEPVSIDATFRLYWEVSEEATYPHDPNQPIIVDFSGAGARGRWIQTTVEPNTIELGTTELLDPNNFQILDLESGSPALWYWYEAPITVTFTKVGEPDAKDWDLIEGKGGYQPVFLRTHSGISGAYFKESWALEEFRFFTGDESQYQGYQATGELSAPESENTPAAPLAIGALALLGLALRRRS